MSIRIAINGYGRMGRALLRAIYERKLEEHIQIIAINGMGSIDMNAHLTAYDSTHGRFSHPISIQNDSFCVDGREKIQFISGRNRLHLPWKALKIDLVYEATGQVKSLELAKEHQKAGAKQVIIANPIKDPVLPIIYGINHELLPKIFSMSSCTTNCVAQMIQALQPLDIQQIMINSVHSYTNDQRLLDGYHQDYYRSRSATQSMIPTKTGAHQELQKIFPSMAIHASAVRIPIPNVSLAQCTMRLQQRPSIQDINALLSLYTQSHPMAQISSLPLVSIDYNHHPASAIFDLLQTIVLEEMIQVSAWYDNEWGFTNRAIDLILKV